MSRNLIIVLSTNCKDVVFRFQRLRDTGIRRRSCSRRPSSWNWYLVQSSADRRKVGLVLTLLSISAQLTTCRYSFSSASSIAISETLKFLLATTLFYRELRRRPHTGCPTESEITPENLESGESDSSSGRVSESNESELTLLSESEDRILKCEDIRPQLLSLKDLYHCFLAEVPVEVRYGFAHLALLYVLINNSIFILFRLADPGTIQLIKSGGTIITALVMYLFVGTRLVKGQWLAIFLQVSLIIFMR